MSIQRQDYTGFWEEVGGRFPSLKGAASTRYYFECERSLCEQFFRQMTDRLVLKTDLWDEAKNSEILLWMANKGARPVGIDLASEVVRQAGRLLERHPAALMVADARSLPFPPNTFDFVYSMGTIEHFNEYDVAVREIYRVLKPSGVAIVGVPNKLDPFLRPLLVHLWNTFGSYPYGMEKSFTAGALRRLLESAGFRALGRGGVLFMPGWLRLMDLWCHVHSPRLAKITGRFILPFAWAYRTFPFVRRFGYLTACAVVKPECPAVS